MIHISSDVFEGTGVGFTPRFVSTYIGIWFPRNDYYSLHNSKFYNYDFGSAAFSTCNDCGGYNTKDQDARTTWLYNTYIDTSVMKRIIYGWPGKGIFLDKDGTFTGLGPGSWATAYFTMTY